MSEFELRLPYRSRDDRFNLGEVGDLTREAISDPQERQVVRGVMFEIATEPGIETYGDALDRLEAAGVEGRRTLVDSARRREGLPTLAQEEGHRAFEEANSQLMPGRDSEGRTLQQCAEPDCGAFPIGPLGFPEPSSARRWWCARHAHLAEPGDFDPPEPKYVLDFGTMSLKATGEEAERLRKEDEEREQAAKARQERQRQEAEAIAEVRERWAEQAAPTNVAGWEVRPNGKVVSFDDR